MSSIISTKFRRQAEAEGEEEEPSKYTRVSKTTFQLLRARPQPVSQSVSIWE